MTKKKLSSSKKGKARRDNKIVALYKTLSGNICNAMELYEAIAAQVGVSHMTVIRVLQDNGVITPKKKQ